MIDEIEEEIKWKCTVINFDVILVCATGSSMYDSYIVSSFM